MKLQAEYNKIKGYTELWIAKIGIDKVKEHIELVREEGAYKDFDIRIANDIVKYGAMYHIMGVDKVCELYDKYSCNDSHITTMCVRIAKELKLI